MIRRTTPISEEQARQLKVGDEVLLCGKVVLSRDIGHKFMKEKKPEDRTQQYNRHEFYVKARMGQSVRALTQGNLLPRIIER